MEACVVAELEHRPFDPLVPCPFHTDGLLPAPQSSYITAEDHTDVTHICCCAVRQQPLILPATRTSRQLASEKPEGQQPEGGQAKEHFCTHSYVTWQKVVDLRK